MQARTHSSAEAQQTHDARLTGSACMRVLPLHRRPSEAARCTSSHFGVLGILHSGEWGETRCSGAPTCETEERIICVDDGVVDGERVCARRGEVRQYRQYARGHRAAGGANKASDTHCLCQPPLLRTARSKFSSWLAPERTMASDSSLSAATARPLSGAMRRAKPRHCE